MQNREHIKAQSSLELLITVSFGLVILLPIVVFAFIQLSTSSSTLSATEAQAVANKLATIASEIGVQGYPAKQLVLIQMPPNVQGIYVGNYTSNMLNGYGHEIIITIETTSGISYITAYTPINVSGYLGSIVSQGTYLVNVSALNSCPGHTYEPCVYISQSNYS
ncbi:MAG: hypothetical protein ACP5RP_03640 [Candidatus Micrarchaeia archaeon]